MNDQNNGKSPIEIKDGLVRCKDGRRCKQGDDQCPYHIDCFMGYPAKRLIADTLAYIQYLEAVQPKWISVKERLPVKQLRVIVRTGHNMVAAGWRSYHVDVKGGELWEVDGEHNYRNDVTNWMPLPEPPKEGA